MSVFLPPTDSLLINYTQAVTTEVTTIPSSSSVLTSSTVSSPTTTSAVSISSSHIPSTTMIPSSTLSTSSSMDSTTSSSSTPSSTVTPSSMQALGGTAGLAGIVVSGVVLIVVIVIATIYFCRRKDGKARPLSRSESRRSTWAWGSRVGPWRLNVSSMAVSEDRSRKSRHTNLHKEFPEIVVLDARPSTDNSSSSLPYVNQPSTGRPPNEINGPLHLTMPYHPEPEKEDLPPERYIPYVAPKKNTRVNSTLGQAPAKRVSINPPMAHYNSRQAGTNSVSAAAPPSHRTSLVMTDHVYTHSRQQSHSRSSSTSSGSQSSRTNLNKIPAPLVIPPKGSRHSRSPPHNSPATVTEETESELGDEVDLTDINKNRKRIEEDQPQLYLHLKDTGEWDRKSHVHFSKESEIDPAGINSRGRQYTEWI